MKNILSFGLGLVLFLISSPEATAQFYSSKTRSLETYRDLPELAISSVSPSSASDFTTLTYVSADTLDVLIYFSSWMLKRDTLERFDLRVMPGRQQLILPLVGLEEGWYSLHVFCKNRKISTLSLQIQR